MLAGKGPHGIFRALGLLARPRHDAGDYPLAPRLVGEPDDRDLGNGGVLAQHLLDLQRGELVSAALQDVDARSPEDAHVALGVTRDSVPSPEPAGAALDHERLARRLGLAVIPGEERGAGHPELIVDHARLHARQWQTDRTGPPFRRVERVRQPDADLGHAEALERVGAREPPSSDGPP